MIVKGPLASIVGTDLQSAPCPLVCGLHHRSQDATKSCGHTRRFGLKCCPAVVIESDCKTHAYGSTVKLADVDRFDFFTIVGLEQGAYPFSQCERTFQVLLIRGSHILVQQLHAGKPAE